jgi:hypothetical protein
MYPVQQYKLMDFDIDTIYALCVSDGQKKSQSYDHLKYEYFTSKSEQILGNN